jgi:ATP-dependent RNA helicase DeaD
LYYSARDRASSVLAPLRAIFVTASVISSLDTSTRFDQLNLSATMLAALAAAGYSEPTPIQAGLIPRALAGVDVLGQARTGTGKTAAFTIPILEQIDLEKKYSGSQALVLVPTRELAVQVREEFVKLAHGRKVHSVALYGGKPIRGQIDKLRRGAEVVIGTPGRVLDHLARGTLELRDLKIIVLDEADRMLDIGFRPDIEKILRRCPQSRQTLLLSATVPPPVERLSKRYMRDPETLNFSPKDVAVETIEQFYFTVDANRKFELLEKLLQREEPRQAIIFCRTKRGTEKVYQRLSKRMSDAATIHGDLAQNVRDRVMTGFRSGEVRYLVATDVVGRGIDVSNISHIINYDLPQFCDDYVHRVGRTGRMGREGIAFSFVTPEEGNELTRIEIRINRLLKRDEIPGVSSVGKIADDSSIPAHSGPIQWTPGSGWGGGSSDAPKPAAETADVSSSDDPGDTAAPAPSAPAKKAGKRYRRAL